MEIDQSGIGMETLNIMKKKSTASLSKRISIASLIISSAGVIIQIIAGATYPAVPPVFFILLIPAALMAFTPWWWTPITAIIGGLFLTVGLFLSGGLNRLFNQTNVLDAAGLWIQTLSIIIALIAALAATILNYQQRRGSR